MKRVSFFALGLLLLTACGGSSSTTYTLSFDTTDTNLQQELVWASMNVAERRLEAMEKKLLDKQVKIVEEQTQLVLTVEDSETADALTAQLTSPFSIEVMAEAPTEEADLNIEGHGGFKRTGIAGADFDWVQSREDPETKKGQVRLLFTPEGRIKMEALFKEMTGKNIGIFVRDRLVSKLQIATSTLDDDIIINGIPDAKMALVFAEDVNVGLHVTFTPVP